MTRCQLSNADVGETLEVVPAGGVDQNRHRPELATDPRKRVVHLRPVGDVGRERRRVVGRLQIDGGDLETVLAQPRRDGLTDSGGHLR